MYRKYYLVEVVLLLLLSHGGWNGPSVTLLSCTSESSKLVRDVVQKRFLSIVERYRVSLPLECPLHPRRDMFWWLQTELEATRREGEDAWHCPVCGQRFRCENTFVTHWDASHSRKLGMVEETVCLDDFCDVFRCDVLRKKMLKMRLEEGDELRKITKHHPPGSQGISVFQHRQQDADDEETVEKKKQCDPRAMSQVHHKCRSLIRQCTIGMVANLSSKDFQDIEDDLDQAICSFLTCDKYWDDFDPHTHHVPVLVFAIFGLLVISLFCFCYYGLWILLEKSPMISNQVCCNCQKASSIDSYYRQKLQKNRHKQNSPEYISRKNSPEYISRKNSPEYATRKNSPDYNLRKDSPEYHSEQNAPEYRNKQNFTDYSPTKPRQKPPECNLKLKSSLRKNSPEYISRENSPEYNTRENSPEYNSRENSPEYNSRENSPEYLTRQNSPEYNSRQNSPENNSRQKSPEYNTRQNSPEFKSGQNSPEFEYRQNSPEFQFRLNSSQNRYYQNSDLHYRQKPPDVRYRQNPEIIYSQSSNTLQLPLRAPSRVS